MPNGNDLSDELDFEGKIKDFTSEGQFLARQLYQTCEILELHNTRLNRLENRDEKTFGVVGGIGVFIGGIITSIISYMRGQ